MESGGKGEEDVGFDGFRDGGLVELLGAGGFGGMGELLGMEEEEEDVEQKVRVAGGETAGMDGLLLRCSPAAAARPLTASQLSPTSSSYRMLCFGGDEGSFNKERSDGFSQKSSASGNESCSSTSSSSSNSSLSKLKRSIGLELSLESLSRSMGLKQKKAAETRGSSDAADRGRTPTTTTANTTATTKSAGAASKKPRKEPPRPPPVSQGRTLKVRKENLGDRISALQLLVSPFGKSDTASVLHEALGYIRFLHGQVQVLSSPYLQQLPPTALLHEGGGGGDAGMRAVQDLRSRGLCLVPVACTMNVARSNGADLWSPATESGDGGGVDCHRPEVSEP